MDAVTTAVTGVVVLAAGNSSRFNGDKLLAPMHDGRAMLTTVMHRLLPLSCPIVIVVRTSNTGLIALCERHRWQYRSVDESAPSMSVSVRKAAQIASEYDWHSMLLCLGDMPEVVTDTLKTMAAQTVLSRPSYKGCGGHPVLFPRQYFAEFGQLTGDVGARAILQRHRDCLKLIEVNDSGVLLDIDTREQWQHYLAMSEK
jgi:molybdenum cofactor cytidylyltransferase